MGLTASSGVRNPETERMGRRPISGPLSSNDALLFFFFFLFIFTASTCAGHGLQAYSLQNKIKCHLIDAKVFTRSFLSEPSLKFRLLKKTLQIPTFPPPISFPIPTNIAVSFVENAEKNFAGQETDGNCACISQRLRSYSPQRLCLLVRAWGIPLRRPRSLFHFNFYMSINVI